MQYFTVIAYVLVVTLIVGVHRHLLEICHRGRMVVGALLRHVILRVIYGRRWQAVSQHRIRRQAYTMLNDRPFLRRDVLVGGAILLSSLWRRLIDGGVR